MSKLSSLLHGLISMLEYLNFARFRALIHVAVVLWVSERRFTTLSDSGSCLKGEFRLIKGEPYGVV